MTQAEYIMSHGIYTDVPGPIMNLNPYSNVDYWYGPYSSVEEAEALVPVSIRGIGLTVGIKQFVAAEDGQYVYREFTGDNNTTYHGYIEDPNATDELKYAFFEVEEYQWKRNINTLEKKGESSLLLELLSDPHMRISENTPIRIKILGNITPTAILIYEVRNELEFMINFGYQGVIPLNAEIPLNLNITGNPRTIVYRIRVTDKDNLYAKTIEDNNYLEVTIDYKEIALYNLNTNSIDSLIVKNANNLQGKAFTFDVGYIDSIQNYGVDLIIGTSTILGAVENISQDSFRVTLPNNLSSYSGEDVLIKISYVPEDGNSMEVFYTIVTIIAKGVFSNIKSELLGDTFYIGNKVACKIYFEAEALQTYEIHSTNQSDFSYSGRIMSYTWNTIYINPENIVDNPKFIFIIDNIKTVTVSTLQGSRIKNFEKTIYGSPEDPRTDNFRNNNQSMIKSFILDIDCFINWTPSTNTIFSIGNISINKQVIDFGTIVYPTPLQKTVHLGFEYQVTNTASIEETDDKVVYNALYIDGVLCSNVLLRDDKIETGLLLNNLYSSDAITINNINIYTNANGHLLPFTERNFTNSTKFVPIILNNYEFYRKIDEVLLDLPILELTALALDDPKYTIRNSILGRKKAIVPSIFGTLEDAQKKYASESVIGSEGYNILLKQRTVLKKALQKSRGVLCSYRYGDNNTGYVEVHTQGTSTLDYRLPNFKFTFLNDDMTVKKVDFVMGYNESVLTAKADYMDSSHLNNTPTASFYNKVIESGIFQEGGTDSRSPSAIRNGLDAVTGVPIILTIKDAPTGTNQNPEFTNYGSFMLNIDKTGDALKFKVLDGVDECISFEGTSNAFDSGLSSRFIITPALENDFDIIHTALENDTPEASFYSEIDDGEYKIIKSELTGNELLSSMVNVLNYLAQGLEYRYPDSDIISDEGAYYTIMPFTHFKRFFKMFYWVANSGSLTLLEYKELFTLYFNYDYCALYFIFLMVFALVDNLGKNCMFDLWFDPEGSYSDNDCRWYPRPYDLDSLTGLENNGYDIIAPFVEINPIFSLDYDLVEANWDHELPFSEYLEENYLSPSTRLPYPEGLNGEAARYSFSSASSNLWSNFYKNFKAEIRQSYSKLRDYTVNKQLKYDSEGEDKLISLEVITDYYKEFVIDLFGSSLYNLDFQLKYLGDPERQFFGMGNRWNKFKNWMRKRLQFCDVYFYYREFLVQLSTFRLEILLDSPQYIITKLDLAGQLETVHFFDGSNKVVVEIMDPNSASSSSGLKYAFWINPEAILEGNIYTLLQSSIPRMPFESIVSLSIKGSALTDIVDISNATYLRTLLIDALKSTYNNPLPPNIRNITVSNSTALLTINDLPYLESITISNCNTSGGTLVLENLGLTNPISLTIENSKLNLSLSNVNIGSFNSSGNTINNLVINNCTIPSLTLLKQTIGTIGFSGDASSIDIIDFRQSTFTNPSMDLSIVASNVKHLLLTDTYGLTTITSSNKFTNLKFLGLMNSLVQNFVYHGDTLDHFDGALLPSVLPKCLYCLNYSEEGMLSSDKYVSPILYDAQQDDYYSGTINANNKATRAFNLEQTEILKVINLNIGSQGSLNSEVTLLFDDCHNLTTIQDSRIYCSGVKMFKKCYNLTTITNSTIKVDTDASYMFAACTSLPYSAVQSILVNNPQIENFSYFLYNRPLQLNTTINLGNYGNAINMTATFQSPIYSARGFVLSSYPADPITITFSGTLPSSLQVLSGTFDSGSNYVVFSHWGSLIQNCTNLADMTAAFYGCKPGDSAAYSNIDTSWFPTTSTELNLKGAFGASAVRLAAGFKFKSNVVNCMSTFYGCKTSGNYTVDVSNIFADCSKLKTASACFYNNEWAVVSDTLILSPSNQNIVEIRGIFATSAVNSYPEVSGKISGNYTTNNSQGYTSPRSSAISLYGIFEGRKVVLPNNIQITYTSAPLSNTGTLERLFYGATIRLDKENESDDAKLQVVLNCRNINYAFYRTNIGSTVNGQFVNGATLDVSLNNTVNANYAFSLADRNLSSYYHFPIINTYCEPPKLPSSISNAQYMFQALSINSIPIDYFRENNLHFSALVNTTGMFSRTLITYLPKDNTYGLLPNTIKSMDYMFYYCSNLRGGIPNNFFNTNTVVTTLKYMFANTGVLFNIDTNERDTLYTPLSIKEQTPNVKDVTLLFYYNNPLDKSNLQYIAYDCFENCTTLSELFSYALEQLYSSGYNLTYKDPDTGDTRLDNILKIKAPVNMVGMLRGMIAPLTFEIEDYSAIKNMSSIIHAVTTSSSYTPEGSFANNNISGSIYSILKRLATSIYPNYETMKSTVTLDYCFGRWAKNVSELSTMSIPPDNDYREVQYWYREKAGTLTTRGYTGY